MNEAGTPAQPEPASQEPIIAATLTGKLTCVACGYDLRGLSVLERCPECGLRIATSILAVVDPRAHEFEPIRAPRRVAAGLLAWSFGAVAAGCCVWAIRAAELPALWNRPHLIGRDGAVALAFVGVACVVVSGLGAMALIRPARNMPKIGTRLAFVGVALYLPLALAFWMLHGWMDPGLASPYFGRLPDGTRTALRGLELSLVAAIVLLLRSNARSLAVRSAILRTGRVDRQTMYAVAAAAGLGVAGDLVRLASTTSSGLVGQMLAIGGVSIVAIASGLLTLGLVGVSIDCTRIASALLRSGRRLTTLVSMVDVARASREADPSA